jgi:hypothetical protein
MLGSGQCPHLAPIAIASTNVRVMVNLTQAVLTAADIPKLKVAGCPFQIPFGVGTKPQPCVSVQPVLSTRVFVNGQPALLNAPTGAMCFSVEMIPQGPPTFVMQTRVGGL